MGMDILFAYRLKERVSAPVTSQRSQSSSKDCELLKGRYYVVVVILISGRC